MSSATQKKMYMIGLILGILFYGIWLVVLTFTYWPLSLPQIIGLVASVILASMIARRSWNAWNSAQLEQSPETFKLITPSVAAFCNLLFIFFLFEVVSVTTLNMFAMALLLLLCAMVFIRISGRVSQ